MDAENNGGRRTVFTAESRETPTPSRFASGTDAEPASRADSSPRRPTMLAASDQGCWRMQRACWP